MPWVFDPHSGGTKIPQKIQETIRQRVTQFAAEHYAGKYLRIDVRFRGPYCYLDAYREPDLSPNWPPPGGPETREEMLERLRNSPTHLCRLRYFGSLDRWSCAFFTYSNEKYTPCAYPNGTFFGTLEEGFEIGATYLM